VIKNYTSIPAWELFSSEFEVEYSQQLDEGRDVLKYKSIVDGLCKLPPSEEKETIAEALADLMSAAPVRSDYSFDEPSDYDAIKVARKPSGVSLSAPENLKNKIKYFGCLRWNFKKSRN